MMNREDLDRESKQIKLLETLSAAKEAARDGGDKERTALHKAKMALSEFRAATRSNSVADVAPGDGVAAPEPVEVITEGG